jgi:hypothetical protein
LILTEDERKDSSTGRPSVAQLVDDLLRQRGAGLELVDDDAFDFEPGVVVGADFVDVVEQAVERAAGELVAVEGDQAGVGGDQRRAGVEVQRRRRVDPDFVVAFERIERLAQLVDLVARFELGLQFFRVPGRRAGSTGSRRASR